MYPRKLTRSIISNPDYPVVETKNGKLRGLWEEGIFLFRGIKYAESERFHMPRPVEPWEGTKEAIIYGPVCKEIHTAIAHDEYNVPHYHYIVIFRATNSILTKGVLRGGGDTRFLLIADTSTMWILAIPIGALAGLVWHLSPFWVFICLHLDQIVKAVWCVFRLKSNKWIKKIKGATQ